MNEQPIDVTALDNIFTSMVRVMDQSKNDIFIISEQSRQSFEEMKVELTDVQTSIAQLIEKNDNLEKRSRLSRQRLADVSKYFQKYSEQEVRKAYELANELLVEHSINQMEEKQLRQRRDELERRLEGLHQTIKRADQLGGQVTAVINYLTSDLKEVGKALEDAKHRRGLAIRIIQAQEEERKKLSRDIHDGPAQMLANVLLRAGLIEKVFTERGTEQAILELRDLKSTVREALIEVRRIIYDLRPMALDDLGLIPTLKKYLFKIEELENNVNIFFKSSGEERRFHTNVEVSVFRLIQESVSNALKHGQPTEITVQVEWLNDILNIMVKDNGHGFDMNEVRDRSFGLIGMKERIDLLKGNMTIDSTIGAGTRILFRIPLENDLLE